MRLDQLRAALDETEDFVDILDRIRELTGYRDRIHLVRSVIAPLLGVTPSAGYKWLRGTRVPSRQVVYALQMLELLLRADGEVPLPDGARPPRLANLAERDRVL